MCTWLRLLALGEGTVKIKYPKCLVWGKKNRFQKSELMSLGRTGSVFKFFDWVQEKLECSFQKASSSNNYRYNTWPGLMKNPKTYHYGTVRWVEFKVELLPSAWSVRKNLVYIQVQFTLCFLKSLFWGLSFFLENVKMLFSLRSLRFKCIWSFGRLV